MVIVWFVLVVLGERLLAGMQSVGVLKPILTARKTVVNQTVQIFTTIPVIQLVMVTTVVQSTAHAMERPQALTREFVAMVIPKERIIVLLLAAQPIDVVRILLTIQAVLDLHSVLERIMLQNGIGVRGLCTYMLSVQLIRALIVKVQQSVLVIFRLGEGVRLIMTGIRVLQE